MAEVSARADMHGGGADHRPDVDNGLGAGDRRPRAAIDAARGFAHGEITADELANARDAAKAAQDAAWAAAWPAGRVAANEAVKAAEKAEDAARTGYAI
jgi:hypothetical protein